MPSFIFGTILIGGCCYLLHITYNHVREKCYIFKSSHQSNYDQRYVLVKNLQSCMKAVIKLLTRKPSAFRVVGLDCEMTSDSVKGGHPVPAILQIANPDGYCAVFQMKTMEKSVREIVVPFLTDMPKVSTYKLSGDNVLKEILEDGSILKVGVGVINDADYLAEGYGLFCKGCLDIRYLAEAAGIYPGGLDNLAKNVLGKSKLEINKKAKKPWESDILNQQLIEYALQDARLGVEIFLKLNKTILERRYSIFRRLFWDEKTFWKYTIRHWRNYIGKHFDFKKTPIVEHRMTWINYIPKGLWIVPESAMPTKAGAEYICIDRRRVCCVCGIVDCGLVDFKLKAVVPVDYGIKFDDPDLFYVPMCNDCHLDCLIRVNYELREELTEECGAPFPDYKDPHLKTTQELAANMISSGATKEMRNSEWSTILKGELFKLLEPTGLQEHHLHIDTLKIIVAMDCWPQSGHGKFVHDYFSLYGGGLEELRWRWCERFWRKMRPQYLPRTWQNFYRHHPRWCFLMSD